MGQIKFETQLSFIETNFSRLVYYDVSGDKEIMLNCETKTQRCRFCGNENRDFFKEKAHVIPHSIGNKVLKSSYECDKCNTRFCKMESQFSNFMALYHVFSHVSRGEKEPIYRNNSKSTIKANADGIDIYLVHKDENLKVELDREGKMITVEGVRSYIPLDVYKVFVKMALCIMPEKEMKYFNSTLKWLMSENMLIPNLYLSIRMYKYVEPFNGACMVYKRKSGCKENVPCYLFCLTYNNFFFQIAIPLCTQDAGIKGKVKMPYIPCIMDKEGTGYNEYWLNLSSLEKVTKEKVSLKFDVGDWII